MNLERWMFLESTPDACISQEEMEQGWHWCYDFDELLVGPGMFELQCCTCDIPEVKKAREHDER